MLERENGELKKLLADQLLETKILKDVAEGTSGPAPETRLSDVGSAAVDTALLPEGERR